MKLVNQLPLAANFRFHDWLIRAVLDASSESRFGCCLNGVFRLGSVPLDQAEFGLRSASFLEGLRMKRSVAVAVSLAIFVGVAAGSVFADPPRVLRSEIQDRVDGGHGRADRADGGAGDRYSGRDAGRVEHNDRDRQQVVVRDDRRDDRDGGRNRARYADHRGDRGDDRDRNWDRNGEHRRDNDRSRDHRRDNHRDHRRDNHRDHDRDRYRVGVYLGSPWAWGAYDRGYGYDRYADRDDCRVVYRWRYNRWGRRYSEPVQVCYDSWGRSYVSPYSDRW